MSFFEELKRRNVVRVGIAYIVAGWLLASIADLLLGVTEAPAWVLQAVLVVLVIGFIPVVVFAWAFELTPDGIVKESQVDRSKSVTHYTAKKLDIVTIVLLVAAIAVVVSDRFIPQDPAPSQTAAQAEAAAPPPARQAVSDIPEKSIAVLPFVNMSNDPEQDYFSDGISEELLNVLAKFPGVQVAARTSSFQFKGKNQDIGEIARMLKVRHVLEGSVRKAGTRLRITAQLIEADSGYHLWSETYDREMHDVFAIQDEISAAIGDALRVELALAPGAANPAGSVSEASSTAAYEAFLQGRHLVNQRGGGNLLAAKGHLERAVRLDPEFAPARAWLGIAISLLMLGPSSYGDYTLEQATRMATPHIEKALELDPMLAEAHGAVAILALNGSDYEKAMVACDRAIELNPAYVDAYNWRNLAAQARGDWETSITGMRRILEIDPLSIIGRLNYSSTLARIDLDAGRAMAHSMMDQSEWAAYSTLGNLELYASGDIATALGWLLKAYGEDTADEFSNRDIVAALSYVGLFEEAERITDRNPQQVLLARGELESAAAVVRDLMAADPENVVLKAQLAGILHESRRFEEAAVIYAELKAQSPGRAMLAQDGMGVRPLLRWAYGQNLAGNPNAVEEAARLQGQDFELRRKLEVAGPFDWANNALSRALQGDGESALTSIQTAINEGLRDLTTLDDPIFDEVRQHPEFIALRADLKGILSSQRQAVLELICNDNPIPSTWQPLRTTCAGPTAGP